MNAVEHDDTDADGDRETKDRHFRPYRVPRSDAARALIAEVQTRLGAQEQRTRRRRAVDERRNADTVTAVVCDVLHHWLTGAAGAVAVSRSKRVLEVRSRYRPAAIGGTLPAVLDSMRDAGLLRLTTGWRRAHGGKGERSTMKAAPALTRMARRHGVTFADLGREASEETIVLKGHRDGTGRPGVRTEAPLVEYDDHTTSDALRRDMATINDHLTTAELDFAEDALRRRGHVDTHDRRLRRAFTRGSFTSGGRLFGGFWQPLSKEERAEGLTISGEPVVELDYSSMGPRLLYAKAGCVPAFVDAYALPGFGRWREGLKKVFNAEMFRLSDQTKGRFPRGTRSLLPPRAVYADVRAAMAAGHPAVAHLFGTDVGHDLQYMESTIMVEVLLRLGREGITALPIHDAVLVGSPHAAYAAEVMEQVSLEVLGFVIPVRRGVV